MFRKCCVTGCKSLRKNTILHCFPTSTTRSGRVRLQKWLRLFKPDELCQIGIDHFRNLYICHLHFEKKFTTASKYRLQSGAYPTLFTEREIKTGVPDKTIITDEENQANSLKTDHSYSKPKHEDHSYAKPHGDSDSLSGQTSDNKQPIKSGETTFKKEVLEKINSGDKNVVSVLVTSTGEDEDAEPGGVKIKKTTLKEIKIRDITAANFIPPSSGEKTTDEEPAKLVVEASAIEDAISTTSLPLIPSPPAPPSPVPSIEEEVPGNLFSWQNPELIPADEVQVPLTAAELLTQFGVSMYCDESPAPQAVPQVPEANVKDLECRCNDCGNIIDGYQFWCVQCVGRAACGACAARGAHLAHYVLRAPPHRPHRQTQLVLATIRHQLQNANMLTQLETDEDGVKLEVKEEQPEQECSSPVNVDPLNHDSALHTVPDQTLEDIAPPCKRPRLAERRSRPEPQEQILISLDELQQQEFIAETDAIDDTDEHIDDDSDSSTHQDDAVSMDSTIDDETDNACTEADVTRDDISVTDLLDDGVDAYIVEDDAVNIESRTDETDIARTEKDVTTEDEFWETEVLDDNMDTSIHEDDAISINSRICDNERIARTGADVTRDDEFWETEVLDDNVDTRIHEDDAISINSRIDDNETDIARTGANMMGDDEFWETEVLDDIMDINTHEDDAVSIDSRTNETDGTRIEAVLRNDELPETELLDDNVDVLEDDVISIDRLDESEVTRINRGIIITRLEDDETDVVESESILSDLNRRVGDTGQLRVRGAPDMLTRALLSKALVVLQPLTSLDIRKYTSSTRKRRK